MPYIAPKSKVLTLYILDLREVDRSRGELTLGENGSIRGRGIRRYIERRKTVCSPACCASKAGGRVT